MTRNGMPHPLGEEVGISAKQRMKGIQELVEIRNREVSFINRQYHGKAMGRLS